MNLLRPALLFWVCILALLSAGAGVGAGAQTQPLEASFEITPAEPVANELVTLSDTTKNPTGAQLQYAWDLDADDQFDDGTPMAVTHAFPAGQHRVSLRVRRVGTVTVTDTETKTITVKEGSAPTPIATPTPTETATPAPVIHAPTRS
jgi:PKD repeat protein